MLCFLPFLSFQVQIIWKMLHTEGNGDGLVREQISRKRSRSPSSDSSDGDDASSTEREYRLINVEHSSTSIVFGASGVRVGRDAAVCELHVSQKDISRLHCILSVVSGKVFVRDMSFNGTFVNARLVGKGRSAELCNGDMMSIVNPFLAHASTYSYLLAVPHRSSASLLPVPLSSDGYQRYTFGAVIGQGSFATVYAATEKKTGTAVAVKVIDNRRFSAQISEDSLRLEGELIHSLQHDNIVRLLDTIASESSTALVMELVNGGDLFDYVTERGLHPFTEEQAHYLFLQLVEAVAYIHSRGIIHSDLKPENVLVEVKCEEVALPRTKRDPLMAQLKLTDFGVARYYRGRQVSSGERTAGGLESASVGTPAYAAPELQLKQFHIESKKGQTEGNQSSPEGKSPVAALQAALPTPAADMWSLGVLLYIVCSGCRPRRHHSSPLHDHMSFLSDSCKDVILRLLNPSPQERITMEELRSHPWVCGSNAPLANGSDERLFDSLTASPTSPRYSSAFVGDSEGF